MSTAVETKVYYTPEDLLAMPDGQSYELVDGQLVERKMGFESGWVGSRLLVRLGRYGEEHELGDAVSSEVGYQCFPHRPGLVRKPDVSFVRHGRLPGAALPKGWARIPPDLAVEVVSPNDLYEELEEKLDDYEKAGVPLIWVISPKSRKVMVYRADGSVSRLREDDELSGEDVIPGFRCPIREILPPREQPEPAQATTAAPDGPG
jgi:Uma2 family endonuclease